MLHESYLLAHLAYYFQTTTTYDGWNVSSWGSICYCWLSGDEDCGMLKEKST